MFTDIGVDADLIAGDQLVEPLVKLIEEVAQDQVLGFSVERRLQSLANSSSWEVRGGGRNVVAYDVPVLSTTLVVVLIDGLLLLCFVCLAGYQLIASGTRQSVQMRMRRSIVWTTVEVVVWSVLCATSRRFCRYCLVNIYAVEHFYYNEPQLMLWSNVALLIVWGVGTTLIGLPVAVRWGFHRRRRISTKQPAQVPS